MQYIITLIKDMPIIKDESKMKFTREYQLESRTMNIWNALKYTSKFNTLDMGVKIHTLIRLDETLKALKTMGKEAEVALITPEFVYNNLNERGMRRNRKILEFCDRVGEEYLSFQLSDEESRNKVLNMIRG